MPYMRKLTSEEAYSVEQQSKCRRQRTSELYDSILAEFNPGDYGEIIVKGNESRTIVRNRLHSAAARRGLTLRFLYARRRQLRFRVGLQPEVGAEQPAVTAIALPHQSGHICSFVPAMLAPDERHLAAQAHQHSEILGRESREALVRLNRR